MPLPQNCLLLRIYVGEASRHEGHPLHEVIVLKARSEGLAGATVLRSSLGYGRGSRLHSAKILRISDDLPLVIEIVDTEEKIMAFAERLKPMLAGGLVTVEKVTVLHPAQP